jgi:hypothetical protein
MRYKRGKERKKKSATDKLNKMQSKPNSISLTGSISLSLHHISIA